MNYNASVNRRPAGMGRKLTQRPHETPGLESTKSHSSSFPPSYPERSSPGPQVLHSQPGVYGQQVYSQGQHQYMHQQEQFYNPQISHAGMSQQHSYGTSVQQSAYGTSVQQSAYGTSVQQSSYVQPTNAFSMPIQTQIFTDPMVANVAMQYGQALMGSSKQYVDKEIEKYVPISRLKYYFSVDTSYVTKKLAVLAFPYIHKDWCLRYDQNQPVQPKYEVNAPDLYIPSMAFLTYILIAGLVLGMNDKFSPEKLSIQASSALAWSVLEVIIQWVTLYITNINANLTLLDLVAYSSYKYVGIIIAMLTKLFFGHVGYIIVLIYVCASFSFFLMKTLKLQVLSEPVQPEPDAYGMPAPSMYQQAGIKRRRYFLLYAALSQPFFMWWLSSNIL